MDPLVGVIVAAVFVAVIAYRRRAFAPGVPRRWRHSHSVAAQLCRRVHRAVDHADDAVHRAERRGLPVTSFEAAVSDLRACASTIDHHLVAASELPLSPRHRSLLALRYRIVDVEHASQRVVTMVNDAMSPAIDDVENTLQRVHSRLDHLGDARREVRGL